jgi:hypothetical protein
MRKAPLTRIASQSDLSPQAGEVHQTLVPRPLRQPRDQLRDHNAERVLSNAVQQRDYVIGLVAEFGADAHIMPSC